MGFYLDTQATRSTLMSVDSTLSENITAAQNYIPIASTTNFSTGIVAEIETTNEVVSFTDISENNLQYSQTFDNAYWQKLRGVISADATTAPDGTTTAEKLTQASGVTSNGLIQVAAGVSAVNTVTYVLSIFAKKGTNRNFTWIKETLSRGGGGITQWFDLDNGTLGSLAPGGSASLANLSDEGDGWYRCSVKFTANATRTGGIMITVSENDGSATNTDDQGFIYLWGAQFEEGSLATSYIPTTTITKSAGGDFKSMSLADIKDTFLHPAIDLLVSGSTGTQQGGTYHISTATSVGGSTEVSGSNTPIFTDTRADTSLYSAAGIPEALDQPTTISNYYLHKITGSDTSYTLPIFTTATNQIQSYPEATFESLLQEWIRNTATSSGDGYEINYSYTTGTNRGSGMGDTTLNGTGDYQTLQVGDDYRAQEFPNGTAVTTNTYYLKINKS